MSTPITAGSIGLDLTLNDQTSAQLNSIAQNTSNTMNTLLNGINRQFNTMLSNVNRKVSRNNSLMRNSMRASNSSIGSSVGKLGSIFSGLSYKILKITTLFYALKRTINLTKECLQLGSDLTEIQNVVDVVFPSMSDRIEEFSSKTRRLYGLSEKMVKDYTGQLGAMSEAIGFTEEEAFKMSKNLTALVGDTASFYNVSQEKAFSKLRTVFSGEVKNLKSFGVIMTQGALNEYAASLGIEKTTRDMTEQEKAALRYNYVIHQLNHTLGDFVRTQDNYANVQRVITLTFEQAKTNFGQGIINLTSALQNKLLRLAEVIEYLSEKFLNFTRKFTKGKDIKVAANGVSSVADSIEDVGDKTEKSQKKLTRFLASFDKLNRVSSPKADNHSDTKTTDEGMVKKLLDVNLPEPELNKTSKHFGKLNEIVDKLKKKFPNLTRSIENCFNSLKKLGKVNLDYLGIFYKEFLKPVGVYALNNLIPTFLDLIAAGLNVIAAILETLKPVLEFLFKKIITPLTKFLMDVVCAVLRVVINLLNKFADFCREHPKTVQFFTVAIISFFTAFKLVTFAISAINAISSIMGVISACGGVVGLVTGALKLMGGALAALCTPVGIAVVAIGGLITAITLIAMNWDTVKEKASNALDVCVEKLNSVKDNMNNSPEFMKNIGDAMMDNFKAPFDAFKSFIDTFFKEIQTSSSDGALSISEILNAIFKSTLNGMITYVEKTIRSIINGINGITGFISNITDKKIGKIKAPELPRFSTGAVVPGTGYNGGIAAIIGDVPRGHSEYVLRDDQLGRITEETAINTARAISSINSNNSNDGTIVVDNYIDGEFLSRSLINRNKKNKLTTGRTIF